jgi:hypothetical protein
VLVSTHVPPQIIPVPEQVHEPLLQISPGPHVMPQPPQSSGLVMVSTHDPLQSVCVVPQPQLPFVHARPAAHALPHEPQWSGSVIKS